MGKKKKPTKPFGRPTNKASNGLVYYHMILIQLFSILSFFCFAGFVAGTIDVFLDPLLRMTYVVNLPADLDMIWACVGIVISVIPQQRHLEEAFLPGAPRQCHRSRHCVRWATVQDANFAFWEIDSICRHAQHRETATAPRAR